MNLIHIYYVPPLGALLERYGSFGPIVLLPRIAFKGPPDPDHLRLFGIASP